MSPDPERMVDDLNHLVFDVDPTPPNLTDRVQLAIAADQTVTAEEPR